MGDEITGVTEAEAERLSLIRYQLIAVGEAASAPPPLNTLAINVMQDVVEATLAAVGDHIRASVPARADFDKLFDAVVAKLGAPDELFGLRSSAIALNNARVGFKHHGNQVPDATLRRHSDVAQTLVRELVLRGFDTNLDDVSLLLFIRHDKVRSFIERAEALYNADDLSGALTYLRVGFDLAVDDYCARKSVDGWKSVFDIEPTGASAAWHDDFGIGQSTEALRKWLKALDQRTRLAAIGVDLSRYAYFDAVAPEATYFLGGDRGPHVRERFADLTGEHYRASYSFVVDALIRLAANDYTLRTVRHSARSPESYDPGHRSERYLEQMAERERRREELERQK